MRILFIGKRYYTNKDALHERFGRIYQLPLHWHEAGHSVELTLLDYRGNRIESTTVDGFDVRSLPARDPLSLFRLRSHVLSFQPDAIVASSDCFIGLAALWLARGVAAKFVFDVYDDYRTFGAYRGFLGWDAFGFLARRADAVWYASRALAVQHPAPTANAVVPNGVNPAEFRPIDATTARSRVGLAPDQLWVGYFGSLEQERGPEDLMAAVGLLHSQDPTIRLVVCGGGAHAELQAPWLEYRGNVPHRLIPDYINACDVVVLPYRRGPTIDMASSCKMAEYLFCQRPIVATRTPSLTSNFPRQTHELGRAVCEPNDPADLARAIEFQLTHGIIASLPDESTWECIAADALGSISR
jgi:glycosyltransferase involved in cell wall biosynthesis